MNDADSLEEWGLKQLTDYENSLKKGANDLKRTRRFSGELALNPEPYKEFLTTAREQGLGGKQILNVIRNIEQAILDEGSRGTVESRKALRDMVVHHLFAQRTAGDTLRNLRQGARKETRAILRDQFGKGGNVDPNLLSFFRSFHTTSEKAKGIEAQALRELNYPPERAGALPTIKAHQTSPTSRLISGTADVAPDDVQGAVDAMKPQIQRQYDETMGAYEQMKPIIDDLDDLVKRAGPEGMKFEYSTEMSTDELRLREAIIDNNADEAKDILKRHLAPYVEKSGFRLNAMDPLSMLLKEAIDNPTGATLGALHEAYNKETIQKFEQGDVVGGGMDVAKGVAIGTVVEKGIQALGPKVAGGVARLAVPLMGTQLFSQGRDDSTTKYLADKVGPSIGMNQDRPSWGTEFGEMNTQKPGYVQAAEDALDFVGSAAMNVVGGTARLIMQSPAAQGAMKGFNQ
jgi:hypothetical protein